MTTSNDDSWRSRHLSDRVFGAVAVLHGAANMLVLVALFAVTPRGGDGKVETPLMEALYGVWQLLGLPLAWSLERALEGAALGGAGLVLDLFVRGLNSVFVGWAVARVWTWERARER